MWPRVSLGTKGGPCDGGEESSGSVNCGQFVDEELNCWLLEKDSALWSS
jgi:hypothetical protein